MSLRVNTHTRDAVCLAREIRKAMSRIDSPHMCVCLWLCVPDCISDNNISQNGHAVQ